MNGILLGKHPNRKSLCSDALNCIYEKPEGSVRMRIGKFSVKIAHEEIPGL